VRSVHNETEIFRILGAARNQNQLTTPLLRAAILSLGQHGCNPSDLLSLASMFTSTQAPAVNTFTGDVLVSSLVQNKTCYSYSREGSTTPLGTYIGKSMGYEMAIQGVLHREFLISDRGYCSIFTFLQRQQNKNSGDIMRYRDACWMSFQEDLKRNQSRLNGRVADSFLRCYGEDVRSAMLSWKSNIKPLLVYAGASDRQDVICKSMEAIMYATGMIRRPDVAWEVVASIRNKQWTHMQRQCLGKAYLHGRNRADKYNKNLLSSKLNGFLFNGFERSIESELEFPLSSSYNISADGKLSGQNIRIIFSDKKATA
jgi:hypothetical protein